MQVSQFSIKASDQLIVFPLLLSYKRRKPDRVNVLNLSRYAEVLCHLRTLGIHQMEFSLKLRAKILRTIGMYAGNILCRHTSETILDRLSLDVQMASDPIEHFLEVCWHLRHSLS